MPQPPKSKSSAITKFMAWWRSHVSRVPFMEKILFVYNLYIMVKAGLAIVAALKILSAQTENKTLRAAISAITHEVERGRQLSEVLAQYPKLFPELYVSMIAAGEQSGKLEQSLRQVSEQMKKSHELRSRVRGALIYPGVIVTAMVGIGIEMVVFVLPKIVVMFEDFNAALPLPTRILIGTVRFMQYYGLWVAALVILMAIGFLTLLKKPAAKKIIHALNLRLPIAGKIIKKINLAVCTLTLSSLLESALPIIDAVRITASVTSNVRYRAALLAAAETLKKGEALSAILSRYPELFPPLVTQMIMVGEESGQVETMLGELSDYYAKEVDATMKNFSTIIEPVIILALGLGVAGIAVAVIMPIYSLAQNV